MRPQLKRVTYLVRNPVTMCQSDFVSVKEVALTYLGVWLWVSGIFSAVFGMIAKCAVYADQALLMYSGTTQCADSAVYVLCFESVDAVAASMQVTVLR